MLSTAFSIASFSIVLAESFAAIGLSTLIPAVFVETASALKKLEPAQTSQEPKETVLQKLNPIFDLVNREEDQKPSAQQMAETLLSAVARSSDTIKLLVPTKASLDAEFEFHAAESYKANMGMGAMIELVTVKAGFSELFATSSSNKVKLHVDFALTEFKL